MIGFYNYTVILTYLSLASSVIGMACAICGMLKWAVCCLAISGLFDAFDGRVARTKRTGQRMRRALEYRLILYVIWYASVYFRL